MRAASGTVSRNMEQDIECMARIYAVTDVISLCSTRDYRHYLPGKDFPGALQASGIQGYFFEVADGYPPSLEVAFKIHGLLDSLLGQGRSVVLCSTRGMGRPPTICVTYILYKCPGISVEEAIECVRQVRGHPAVQTVKQYNFCYDFFEYVRQARNSPVGDGAHQQTFSAQSSVHAAATPELPSPP